MQRASGLFSLDIDWGREPQNEDSTSFGSAVLGLHGLAVVSVLSVLSGVPMVALFSVGGKSAMISNLFHYGNFRDTHGVGDFVFEE